jgi:hypothetical protein
MMAKGQGWHGDSKGHSNAAKGQGTNKDNTSSSSNQGWHGDSEGHSRAAKGKSKEDENSLMDELFGND